MAGTEAEHGNRQCGADDRIELMCVDMNGIPRGKWVPASQLDDVLAGKVRLPLSTQSLDIWGEDNDALVHLSQSIGDPDGFCIADERTLVPMPWSSGRQVIASLRCMDGTPSFMDPREILRAVMARFAAHGWSPVIAFELEFYVIEPDWTRAQPTLAPASLRPGGASNRMQLYELAVTDTVRDFLTTIQSYAAVQRVPTETIIAEFGPGQFEVNLMHRTDALIAADDVYCLKRLIDQAALRHGMESTFMAKPYTYHAGSGMHMHMSVVDRAGDNIFDGEHGLERLHHAVAGLVSGLPEAQAILAPHGNSYRRFQPDSFAPVRCNWAREHRGAAVRIPEWRGPASRVEVRVAGADANPYLVAATLLGCLLEGLETSATPPPPLGHPDYVVADVPMLSHDWLDAVDTFAASPRMAHILGERYRDLYATVKHHEAHKYFSMVTDVDRDTYLSRL